MVNLAIFDLYINFFWDSEIESLIYIDIFKIVRDKYIDPVNVFWPDLAVQIPEYSEINNHTIKKINW